MSEDNFQWTDSLVKEYLRLITSVEGNDYWQQEINKFKASKTPVKEKLFTTNDGVDIYEGDKCTAVRNYEIIDLNFTVNKLHGKDEYCKYFSTEQAASEYVFLNRPLLSFNDVINLSEWYSGLNTNEFRRFKLSDLKELSKQKLSK